MIYYFIKGFLGEIVKKNSIHPNCIKCVCSQDYIVTFNLYNKFGDTNSG